MAITLFGNQTGLILVSESFNKDNEGKATLQRSYSCAQSYEATADPLLAINTAPLSYTYPTGTYTMPTGVYNLTCVSSQKGVQNGVVTYSVNYVGLTTNVFATRYGTALLSYSKSVTTGSGSTAVTDLLTGSYIAPTTTRFFVSATAAFVPSTPTSAYNIQVVQSFTNGVAASAPTLTSAWSMTNLTSSQFGSYYVIEVTGTKLVT
jgi:hypothetical protein